MVSTPCLVSLTIHGIPLTPRCPVADMLGREQLGHIASRIFGSVWHHVTRLRLKFRATNYSNWQPTGYCWFQILGHIVPTVDGDISIKPFRPNLCAFGLIKGFGSLLCLLKPTPKAWTCQIMWSNLAACRIVYVSSDGLPIYNHIKPCSMIQYLFISTNLKYYPCNIVQS